MIPGGLAFLPGYLFVLIPVLAAGSGVAIPYGLKRLVPGFKESDEREEDVIKILANILNISSEEIEDAKIKTIIKNYDD